MLPAAPSESSAPRAPPKHNGEGIKILGAAKEPGPRTEAKTAKAGAGGGKQSAGSNAPARKKPQPKARAATQPATSTTKASVNSSASTTATTKPPGKAKGKPPAAEAKPRVAPAVEPLRTTYRATLSSFRTRDPAPFYSSPMMPSSFSTAADPRSTAPAPTADQSALHQQVLQSWVESQPSPSTLAAREVALQKVARAVSSFAGDYKLALFGSVANGVDNDASDLDICIIDESLPQGYDPALDVTSNRKGIYNMFVLGDRLSLQGMINVEPIPYSNTPIVKCQDPTSGIDLDLNVNDRGGYHNTNLIESYCYLSPYALRPLLNAVKKWGKARCVASQSTNAATFSSYGLNLLCISYLLSSRPPGVSDKHAYLPNLQAEDLIKLCNVPTSSLSVRLNKRELFGTHVNTTFVPVHQHASGGADGGQWGLSQDKIAFWRERNAHVDLGELLLGFFRFYSEGSGSLGWRWADDGASILHGGRISRRSPKGTYQMSKVGQAAVDAEEHLICAPVAAEVEPLNSLWKDDAMLIQDPFIVSKNCARPIAPKIAQEIKEEFARAVKILDLSDSSSFDRLCEPYTGTSRRAMKQLKLPSKRAKVGGGGPSRRSGAGKKAPAA